MTTYLVGPIGNSYFYRFGNKLSEPYANFQSAWGAAHKPQHVNSNGRWEPEIVPCH
jgi:hypothetical protein